MISILGKYNQLIIKKPLLTNMVSTGILFGTGDYLAQTFFPTNDSKTYDYGRTCRAMIYGTFFFGPIGDRWYKILNKVKYPFNTTNINPQRLMMLNTICKVSIDQLFFAPIIGIPMYYGVMTIMENPPNVVDQIESKIKKNLWPTISKNWMIWPLVQLLNFGLVPVRFNLLLVNVVSIGWNCYLSYLLNSNDGVMVDKVEESNVMI